MGLDASCKIMYLILAYSTCRFFLKMGPRIFWKLYALFYVLSHEKNHQEKYQIINQQKNAMQFMMAVDMVQEIKEKITLPTV